MTVMFIDFTGSLVQHFADAINITGVWRSSLVLDSIADDGNFVGDNNSNIFSGIMDNGRTCRVDGGWLSVVCRALEFGTKTVYYKVETVPVVAFICSFFK